jgi:hypothetical protein
MSTLPRSTSGVRYVASHRPNGLVPQRRQQRERSLEHCGVVDRIDPIVRGVIDGVPVSDPGSPIAVRGRLLAVL